MTYNLVKGIYAKGFRRIGELNSRLDLDSKIVVLYGPNSGGKSSLTQAVLKLLECIYPLDIPNDIGGVIADMDLFLNVDYSEMAIRGEVALPAYGHRNFEVAIRKEVEITRLFRFEKLVVKGNGEVRVYVDDFDIGSTSQLRIEVPLPTIKKGEVRIPLISLDSYEHGIFSSHEVMVKAEDVLSRRDPEFYKLLKGLREDFLEKLVKEFKRRKLKLLNNLVKYVHIAGFEGVRNEVESLIKKSVREFGFEFLKRIINELNDIVEAEFDIIIDEGVMVMPRGAPHKALDLFTLSDGFVNVMRIVLTASIMDESVKILKEVLNVEMPRALLILDTPEFNIHVDWLQSLIEYLANLDNVQVIIETHNGLILAYAVFRGFKAYYVESEGNAVRVKEVNEENINDVKMFTRERDAYARAYGR